MVIGPVCGQEGKGIASNIEIMHLRMCPNVGSFMLKGTKARVRWDKACSTRAPMPPEQRTQASSFPLSSLEDDEYLHRGIEGKEESIISTFFHAP